MGLFEIFMFSTTTTFHGKPLVLVRLIGLANLQFILIIDFIIMRKPHIYVYMYDHHITSNLKI